VIALDTNVFVRFLVEDDAEQAARAKKVVRGALDAGEPVFVSAVVLSELAWVLERAYELPRRDIAAAVEGLLAAHPFEVEHAPAAARALARYRRGRAGYPDYLIQQLAAERGCAELVTFDRELLREDGFTRP
jgi:predicted nucleic-acid-binding protein